MSLMMQSIIENIFELLFVDKSVFNKTVSDSSDGDKVSKTLLKQNHGIIKGTDPIFSSAACTFEKKYQDKQLH